MNHVLIVDDEAEIRESLEGILREEDYLVTTAATAGEALELLRDAAYDLVARHRYRWFGKTEYCGLIPPELEERVVH